MGKASACFLFSACNKLSFKIPKSPFHFCRDTDFLNRLTFYYLLNTLAEPNAATKWAMIHQIPGRVATLEYQEIA